jgi:aryl-phospho-beta-D-glucosidase BglC (GH1 family)
MHIPGCSQAGTGIVKTASKAANIALAGYRPEGSEQLWAGSITQEPEMSTSTLPNGYLKTSGNQIVGPDGIPVRIDAIGWSGADGGAGSTLRGLEYRSYQDILKTVKADGFNTVRIAWSDVNLQAKASASALQAHNPTLVGKTTLDIFNRLRKKALLARLR